MRVSAFTHIFRDYATTCFLILFIFNFLLFCPGMMSADSEVALIYAKAHTYGDHHPPLMGLVWHYMLYLHDGPLLMYLYNLICIWGTVYVFTFKIFKDSIIRWYFLAMPFFPQVLIYSGFIWKDNIFTFTYGFLVAWLLYLNTHSKKMNKVGVLSFWLLLFYASSVKYQARFICPFMIYWFFHTQFKFKQAVLILIGILGGLTLTSLIDFVNYKLTNNGQSAQHSWQYRDIYDLSGMSINLDQVIIPKFLHKSENLSVHDLKNHYTHEWEPLIVYNDSPLRVTKTSYERTKLHEVWLSSIFQHPMSYLKHRINVWNKMVLVNQVKQIFDRVTSKVTPMQSISFLFHIFSYIFLLPFQIWVFYFCWKNLMSHETQYSSYEHAGLIISLMSFTLLSILFLFTLAGVPRYIYFCFYMFFLSFPISIYCLFDQKKNHA